MTMCPVKIKGAAPPTFNDIARYGKQRESVPVFVNKKRSKIKKGGIHYGL
jgi:hypothetical protein